MTGLNPSMAFYSGVSSGANKKSAATTAGKESGRMTACTIAVGDGMDWGEVIQVTANGELTVPPDHCRLLITVSGSKENVQDVKNSVTRRLDYVLQTLRNYQIKDTSVTQNLQRINGMYQLDAEVLAKIEDLSKYQQICNLLVEKLDEHVKLLPPELSHSHLKLDSIKTKASVLAINNCKLKATELAKAVGARVGRVLSIKEHGCTETEGLGVDSSPNNTGTMNMQQRIDLATVRVTATVEVTFELKGRSKVKKQE